MKTLIMVSTLIFASLSFGQMRNLDELSQAANQLVMNYGDRLDSIDQAQVRRHLRAIQFVFRNAGYSAPNTERLICSNNAELLNLETGTVIYKFTFTSTCREALKNAQQGLNFCADGAELVSPYSGTIYDFSFSSNCKEAINDIREYGRFCGNNADLRDDEGTLIYDFSFNSECREALKI